MLEMKWIIPSYIYSTKEPPKIENVPITSGRYIVAIDGDSEYSEGYCVYSYPAYVTIMDVVVGGNIVKDEKLEKRNLTLKNLGIKLSLGNEDVSDLEEGEIRGKGFHDEEWDMVIAWMGPIPEIPKEVR